MTTEAENKINKDLAHLDFSENQLKLVKGIIKVAYLEGKKVAYLEGKKVAYLEGKKVAYLEGKIDGITEFGKKLEEKNNVEDQIYNGIVTAFQFDKNGYLKVSK